MSAPLAEFFSFVVSSDVFDYGADPEPENWGGTVDFLGGTREPIWFDWIITNPPFNVAEAFAQRALSLAKTGVALLVRSGWLEGVGRYERLFRDRPPTLIAQFVERVPMVRGRWDPDASSATSYCWIVWVTGQDRPGEPVFAWIPPGQRERLTTARDRQRFAYPTPQPLFDVKETV
jgi:hypothetical protein